MNEWDTYWAKKSNAHHMIYDQIAIRYRKYIIKPYLKKYIYKCFTPGSTLLHAGCGSGQVEDEITNYFTIIDMDMSINALEMYKNHHDDFNLVLGDILNTGFKNESLDGIYNLGVMEHFTKTDFKTALIEFNRILKPDGTVILFIPPEYGSTVIFFKIADYILNSWLKRHIYFQPPEINRIQSEQWMQDMINGTGFQMKEFNFGITDLYTHVAVILKKIN